jgi:hypothetical protein
MRIAVILYITLTFIVTTHAREQASADDQLSQEITENLSIIDNPANVLNAEVTQCQDESKKNNCDSYFASLTDQERRLLKAKLTCFAQADVTKCGVIAGWLKRKLPGYEHTDTAKYRSLIQSNFAFLEKHQAALSLCLPEYDQLARNLCLLKPNLDALQIKLQKIRVTPEGLFNDYDREVEWLVMKTKDQELELSTPVSSIGRKGINSFYVTKVITGRGQSNRRSVFEKPLGVYSLVKQEIHLENPKLTTSSEDYYGRELKSVNFEYGADFKFGMNKLKPNITVCESLSEAPSLIAEARAKLGKGWDPNNSTKLAQEAIAAAEREGLQIGLYNLQDAGKGFVEGIEGLIKLLKNEETPDPEGQNQCVKEENKKIAADFGNTCSGMFTILKRALGDEADALMNPCYTQHCPGKTPAECFMSQQVNPILRGKIAGCVGYMMKERYGPGIIKLIQKCTGQTGANEFSRCMADISVMAAGGALTAGIAQGVVAGSALAQSGLKAAVEAGKLSVNAVKWLSRGVNATKFAGLFAADLLFNPLPTDPVDLLKTRKGLLALIKDGKAPKDLLDQAQKKLTEVDAAIKASEDAKALNLTTDTKPVSGPKTTPADTIREEKLTSELAQNMHASWRKTFQAKNGDAPRNKPVPLDANETPQAALKRLEAEGYQGLSIEDGKLVQNINQDSKDIVPSLSLALNGGPASDYAKIAINGKFDSPADIEKMADEVHQKWMKHNEWQKDSAPQLFVEYSKLTPEEKLKDLDVLEEALRLKDPKILEGQAYKSYRKQLLDEIEASKPRPVENPNAPPKSAEDLANARKLEDEKALEALRLKISKGEPLKKQEMILANLTDNGRVELSAVVKKNATLTDAQRTAKLNEYLKTQGRSLTSAQADALIKAHNIGETKSGSSVYKYTEDEIQQKIKVLREAGLRSEDIYYTLKSGLAGGSKNGILNRLLGLFSKSPRESLGVQEYVPRNLPLNIERSPAVATESSSLARLMDAKRDAIAQYQYEILEMNQIDMNRMNTSPIPGQNTDLNANYQTSTKKAQLTSALEASRKELQDLEMLQERRFTISEDTELVHFSMHENLQKNLDVDYNYVNPANPSIAKIQESTSSGSGLYTVPLRSVRRVENGQEVIETIGAGGNKAYVIPIPKGATILDLQDPVVNRVFENIKKEMLTDPTTRQQIDNVVAEYAKNSNSSDYGKIEDFKTTYVNQQAIERLALMSGNPDLIVGSPTYGSVVLSREVVIRNQTLLQGDRVQVRSTGDSTSNKRKPDANSELNNSKIDFRGQSVRELNVPEAVKQANASADDLTRRANIRRDLENYRKSINNSRSVTDGEVDAVIKAHEVTMVVNSQLEFAVGRKKMNYMLSSGLSSDEARLMIKLAHAGIQEKTISRVDLDDFFTRARTSRNVTPGNPNNNITVESVSDMSSIKTIELKGDATDYTVSVTLRDGTKQMITKATVDQADKSTSTGITRLLENETTQTPSELLFRAVQSTIDLKPSPLVKSPKVTPDLAPAPRPAPAPAILKPTPTPQSIPPYTIVSKTAPPPVEASIDTNGNLAKNWHKVYQPYFERYKNKTIDMVKKENYVINPSIGPRSSTGNTIGTIQQKFFSAIDETSPNIAAAGKQISELLEITPKLGLDSIRQQHMDILLKRAGEIISKGRTNNDELSELFMIHRGIGMIVKDASGK